MRPLRSAPTQAQLEMPFLQALEDAGGKARLGEIYDRVAEKVRLSTTDRSARVVGKDGTWTASRYERDVRWSAQRLKLLTLAQPIGDGNWQLTGKGREKLRASTGGLVITVFVTEKGAALWASAEDGFGYLEDNSCQLLLTSPPYALVRQKQYGNLDPNQWLNWFMRIAEKWPDKLTRDGSILLNLGDVFEPGRPSISLYQERLLIKLADELGLRLCQRFAWLNPAKLPAPAEYVTIRRVRVKNSLEQLYWLSPHDNPYADNRQVLRPYSEAMQRRLAAGGERAAERPSGYAMKAGAFSAENEGSIPDNLIVAANTDSNGSYLRYCREQGLPVHPARFPPALAEFFIKLLSRPGDLVADPFGGSSTTGQVAEKLDRRWFTTDRMLDYVLGAAGRFTDAPGFQMVSPA